MILAALLNPGRLLSRACATDNNDTSPEAGLANLFGGTFLPWNLSNTPTFLPGQNATSSEGGDGFNAQLWYWEANTAGNLTYPHAVQLVVGSFTEMFGTELGRHLQAWCARWGWPLAWAPGDTPGFKDIVPPPSVKRNMPGRLLDPWVLASSRAGRNLTVPATATHSFAQSWGAINATLAQRNATAADFSDWWASLRAATPSVLELEPLRGGSCAAPAAGRCVGTNGLGDCVCYG